MKHYYKIKKTKEDFEITQNEASTVSLRLNREQVINVLQHQHAIIAEKKNGNYDLYIYPSDFVGLDPIYPEFERSSHPLLVFSNMENYLFYESFLAFKFPSENCWRILLLENFEMDLSEIVSLDGRLKRLPCISCKNSNAYFLENFKKLSFDPETKQHIAIFHVDGDDFLISAKENQFPRLDSGIEVSCLGIAMMLPGGGGKYFKTKDRYGNQYLYESFLRKTGPYSKIEELEEKDYPSIYPIEKFTGYCKRDKDGFIHSLIFISKTETKNISICAGFPVKELHFMDQCFGFNHDEQPCITGELWKATGYNDEEFLLKISGTTTTVLAIKNLLT